MAGKDEDSGHLPAVLGVGGPGLRECKGTAAREGWGWGFSISHPTPTLSRLPTPLPHETAACCPLRTLGLRGHWLGAGREMSTDAHAWHGSGRVHKDTRKDPGLSFHKPGPARAAPIPDEWQEEALQGTGAQAGDGVRSTSRHTQPGCPRSTGRGGSSPHE